MAKPKKAKAVNYVLLPNADGDDKPEPWRLREDAVEAWKAYTDMRDVKKPMRRRP